MKIKTRNRLIIGLFVVGLAFYGAIEGLILPQREAAPGAVPARAA